jgi:hypothetical protein
MALIPYLGPGEKVTADKWNTLYAEIDARLAKHYSNLSILLWGDAIYSRRFYFFPPENNSPTWDSVGRTWFDWRAYNFGFSPFHRRYEHNIFHDLINSLPVASEPLPGAPDQRPAKDEDWPVVRLRVDDFGGLSTQWSPLIWPDNNNWPAADALFVSLEAHKRNLNGKDYFVYIDYSGGPEYIHKFSPVEIILGDIGPSFTFPDNWNKYNVFRFHNLQPQPLTVNFGSHFTFTVPPTGSRCVRRTAVNGAYTVGFNYFQKLLPGDPWFFKWNGGAARAVTGAPVEDYMGMSTDWCNVTDIFCGLHVGGLLYNTDWDTSFVPDLPSLDHTKIWDVSSIYCNADYPGGKFEVKTPAGGYFPTIADSLPIGDLCFHRGKLLVVNPGGAFRVRRTQTITVPLFEQPPRKFVLRKADSSIALGVEDLTVKRGEELIPEFSDAAQNDINWHLDTVLDGTLQPLYFYISLIARDSGSDPKLAPDDEVKVTFTHLTDDQKYQLEFDGMASFASKLAEAGVTLTNPIPPGDSNIIFPQKRFQLTCNPERDIIGVSCNMINGVFGLPARTAGKGTLQSPGLVFPFLWAFLPLMDLQLQTDEITVQWVKWEIDGDGNYINVDWDYVTYETSSYVAGAFNVDNDIFSFYDTIGTLLNYFRSKGGVLSTNAWVNMTVFGPMINWTQSIPLKCPGNGFDWTSGGFDFELKKVGLNLVAVRSGITPLSGSGGAAAVANFGWPAYYPYPQFGVAGGMPAIEGGAMANCFPRFERFFQNHRFFTHDPAKQPFASPWDPYSITSEHPMLKSFYESKPFDDAVAIPARKAPVQSKTGVSFLGPFPQQEFDIFTRLSAWMNYSVLTFQTSSGAQVYNFNKGQPRQVSYYTNMRQNVLNNTPIGEDGAGAAKNALPMEIEHYNGAASAMNAITGTGSTAFFSDIAYILFSQFQLRPGKGLGYGNFRPRNQWVCWDERTNPLVTPWMQARGITVRSGADLPGPLQEYVDKNQLWALWDWQSGGPAVTENRGSQYGDPHKMHECGWGDYLFANSEWDQSLFDGTGGYRTPSLQELNHRINNYRWLTIDDARALHQALGIPFWFEELAVPCQLLIRNANWTALSSRGGGFGGGQLLSRAAGFVNRPEGAWVLDNDAGSSIRGGLEQVDYCLYTMGWGSDSGILVLYDADYQELQERFYQNDGLPVPATQLIRSNKYYLWRSYGGPNARCVIYPRNYADYERNYDNSLIRYLAPGGFAHIPRRAVNGLEDGDPQVIDLRANHIIGNPDEAIITTDIENAVFSIYPYSTPF